MEKSFYLELERAEPAGTFDVINGIGLELRFKPGAPQSASRIFLTREQAIGLANLLREQVDRLPSSPT
ncbi:hypothetical protein HpMS107_60460 [Helicobacter pylori]